jgi:phosphatidylglycerophosphate synthase
VRVWIDATRMDGDIRVFGMSLLERHLRALLDARRPLDGLAKRARRETGLAAAGARLDRFVASRVRPTEVRIELRAGATQPDLPKELLRGLPLRWFQCDEPIGRRLRAMLRDADGEPVLALSGDTLADARLVGSLLWANHTRAFVGGEGEERGAVMRIEGLLPEAIDGAPDLLAVAEASLAGGAAKELSEADFDAYIPKLRRVLPPYVRRIACDATRRRAERFLFDSNYKGATDFLTKHVYPPLVWRMVHPLARRRVHPNWVTAIGILATFAAVPLFAAGAWLSGLVLAFVMSVLDSVDGKLARLTFRSSEIGNVLDHGTDLVHPPIWYCAWAWGLGGAVASPVFQASLWMAALYVLDRLLEKAFKLRTGCSVQDYRPLDVRLRTFASRRNVNLALFAAAVPLGLGEAALYAIVAWQAATAGWHLVRLIQFWKPERPTAPAWAGPLPDVPGAVQGAG